jgi:Family of unknown function (DUF6511)
VSLCYCCHREAKGFYYQRRDSDPRLHCCSMICLDIIRKRQWKMLNPTIHEIAAIEAASGPAGEFVEDHIGKTDMAQWSADEWLEFLEIVVTAYTDELRRLTDSGEPPF